MTRQEYINYSVGTGLILMIDTTEWFVKRDPFFAELTGVFDFEYYTVKYVDKSNTTYTDNMRRFTPILRPLSDLSKPIVHNGKTFIPIVELAKLTFPEYDCSFCNNSNNFVWIDTGWDHFKFSFDGTNFHYDGHGGLFPINFNSFRILSHGILILPI